MASLPPLKSIHPLVIALVALTAGCRDRADLDTDVDRARASADALLEELAWDVDGARRIPRPNRIETGPRVERLCTPDSLEANTDIRLEVVLDDPSVRRLALTLDFATEAIVLPVEPDADGRVVITGRIGSIGDARSEVFLQVRALSDAGSGPGPAAEVRVGQAVRTRVCAYAAHTRSVTAIAFGGPSGQVLITGSSDGRVGWWDTQTGHRIFEAPAHTGRIRAVNVAPDGSTGVTGSEAGRLRRWLPDGTSPGAVDVHDGPISSLRIAGRGSRSASASWDGVVWLIDLANAVRHPLPVGERVNAVAFSRDSAYLAAVSGPFLGSGRVLVWALGDELTAARLILDRPLEGHGTAVAFTADGQRIITAHGRGVVDVFELDGSTTRIDGAPDDLISGIAVIPEVPDRFLVAAFDGRVAVGDLSASVFESVTQSSALVEAVALSPTGQSVALAQFDGTVRVFALPTTLPP